MPIRRISEDDVWVTNADGDVIGIQLHGRTEMVNLSNPVNASTTPSGWDVIYDGNGEVFSATIKQNTQVSTGAVTTEETFFEVIVPAGLMRENSEMVIEWLTSFNNSAGQKSIRAYFGATSMFPLSQTTVMSFRGRWKLANRNSLNAQISGASAALTGYMEGGSGSAVSTHTVDFSQDQVLKITGQKSVAGDSFALEQVTVTVR